jgi:predicted DNA binding CopG/RHH family protein
MQMASFVEALQSDLEQLAAVGDDAASAAGQRLAGALRASAGLRLLDALKEAALELNAQLPEGHVEVRLAGQDPSLVYVEDAPQQAAPSAEDALSVRITLRLPESLKAAVESAAARDGVSVNTWLVRALARAVSGWASRSSGPGNRLKGYARS